MCVFYVYMWRGEGEWERDGSRLTNIWQNGCQSNQLQSPKHTHGPKTLFEMNSIFYNMDIKKFYMHGRILDQIWWFHLITTKCSKWNFESEIACWKNLKGYEIVLDQRCPSVNLTIILWAAFTRADPESAKKTLKLWVFFALSGSARVKAACRTLMKLTLVPS